LLALLSQFAGCRRIEILVALGRTNDVQNLLAKVEAEELRQETAPGWLTAAWWPDETVEV